MNIISFLENPAIFGALVMSSYAAIFIFIAYLMLSTTKPRKR